MKLLMAFVIATISLNLLAICLQWALEIPPSWYAWVSPLCDMLTHARFRHRMDYFIIPALTICFIGLWGIVTLAFYEIMFE